MYDIFSFAIHIKMYYSLLAYELTNAYISLTYCIKFNRKNVEYKCSSHSHRLEI